MPKQERAKKIVIVDDEKSYGELLSFVLKKEGFEVKYYFDPAEALLNIISDKPDIILLDLSMPNINGFGVLEHIKKDLSDHKFKIIIITNLKYTDSGIPIDENFIESLGVDDFYHKTGDLNALVNKIKNLI